MLRLQRPLSEEDVRRLRHSARWRRSRLYDTGFNLQSRGRQFWERATVTPASLYNSPSLTVVFDGELCKRGGWARLRRVQPRANQ